MRRTISSAARQRLALVAFASLWLSACGGGGGDTAVAGGAPASGGPTTSAPSASGSPVAQGPAGLGPASTSTPAPGPSAGPATAGGTPGAPAPQSAPAAAAFSSFGPVQVGQNPDFYGGSPAIARLGGGGNVALWVAHGSTTSNSRLVGQLTDGAGNLVGAQIMVQDEVVPVQYLSVAPTPDGGFLVAWAGFDGFTSGSSHPLVNVQARRYSATGVVLGSTRLAQESFYGVGGIVIQPTADGYAVGWSSAASPGARLSGYLQRLDRSGALVGSRVELEPGTGASQFGLSIVPLPDGSVGAVWLQGGASYTVHTRHFDSSLQPLNAATELTGISQASGFVMSAAPVGPNIGLAWTATVASGAEEVRTAVIAPEASTVGAYDAVIAGSTVTAVQVLPFASDFGVVWQEWQLSSETAILYLQRHAASGTVTSTQTELNRRVTASNLDVMGAGIFANNGVAVAGGADGHVVATFGMADQAQPNQYVLGR